METKKFVIVNDHDRAHEDHIYIKKIDKDRKFMEEFKLKNCHEAQMFKKEDGTRTVLYYD